MKPYLLTRANVASELMRPMLGPFRRLDRAYAPVVRRVHVAHLEAGALAGETARPERRETALVGDLAQRIGLIHELRQLRRAEELAHGGGSRLGVDQVLRHHRIDIDLAHALLDGTLHAKQTEPVLVLHQLADRANAPIAEMVDVVDFAAAIAQVHESPHDRENILATQSTLGVGRIEVHAHVHLHAADGREIVALGIEEQRLEHLLGGVERRRLTGAHHAIDVEQRLLTAVVLVHRERVSDVGDRY